MGDDGGKCGLNGKRDANFDARHDELSFCFRHRLSLHLRLLKQFFSPCRVVQVPQLLSFTAS